MTSQVIRKLNHLKKTLRTYKEDTPTLRNNEKWLYNILTDPTNDYKTKLHSLSLFMDVDCVKEPNDDTSTKDNLQALKTLFKEGEL